MKGYLQDKTWIRRPELKTIRCQRHKTIPNLTFCIGEDENGKADVQSVTYPDSWDEDRIQQAIDNREDTLKKEGCAHCRELNASRTSVETKQDRGDLAITPIRPLRSLIQKVKERRK